jgi:hypothetical protein
MRACAEHAGAASKWLQEGGAFAVPRINGQRSSVAASIAACAALFISIAKTFSQADRARARRGG